jgi:NAD(P)H-hydrate epimerase
MKILTASQMGEVDRLTTERYRMPSMLLMENAGRSFVEELEKACPGLGSKRIVILCGRGNNGGDGFVAARYLALRNVKPSILLFSDPDKLKGDARLNYDIACAMDLPIQAFTVPADAKTCLRKMAAPGVIIDALFGTGLSKAIGPDYRPIVDWINRAANRAFVASVDIPSGLFADSAAIPGPAVKAHLTVTFSALKLAHVMPPAADYAGKTILMPIGTPHALFENPDYKMNLIDPAQVRKTLPGERRTAIKALSATCMWLPVPRARGGAALMTGLAALRSGAGLVTLGFQKACSTA